MGVHLMSNAVSRLAEFLRLDRLIRVGDGIDSITSTPKMVMAPARKFGAVDTLISDVIEVSELLVFP